MNICKKEHIYTHYTYIVTYKKLFYNSKKTKVAFLLKKSIKYNEKALDKTKKLCYNIKAIKNLVQ